jgi:hypothetical protein
MSVQSTSSWQSIETAPKDGREIIGREADGTEEVLSWFDYGGCWWNSRVPYYPTHWKPYVASPPPSPVSV